MSRVGKMPIAIPDGTTATIANGQITVKGPLGSLSRDLSDLVVVKQEDKSLKVEAANDSREAVAMWGTTRALLNNMVVGVTEGYKKELEINGVGYRAAKQGKQLVLNIGYSHQVVFDEPDGITFDVPNPNAVVVSGADKQKVGQIASEIRGKRPPEPYLGKGIKYADERIRRKSGKAGK